MTEDTFTQEPANWRMRVDGSRRQRLPGSIWDVPSPNGNLVQIYDRIVDANGKVVRRLRPGLGQDDFYASPPLWSPDGRFIAIDVVKLNKADDEVGAWVDVIPTEEGGRGVAVTPRRVGRFMTALSWSPDSRRMLVETHEGRSYDWYTIAADGSDQRRLLHLREGLWDNHAWSSNSRKIAFVGRRGGIFVMDADSGRPRRIAATRSRGDEAGHVYVDWSSRGEIVFSDKGGTYAIRADGTGRRRLSTRTGAPKWSPDGRKFVLSNDGQIYVVDRNGRGRRLTRWISDDDPQVSPDGRRIAFARGHGVYVTNPSVYVMNANGGGLRRLGQGHRPRWSVDGSRIAYVVDRPNPQKNRVVVADPNGSAPQVVIDGESPTWAPGGRLAFMRYDYVFEDRGDHGGAQWYVDRSKLVAVNREGGEERVVATFDGVGEEGSQSVGTPLWSPDGRTIALHFSSESNSAVLLVDATDGTQRSLAGLGSDALEWSPDGTQMLAWDFDTISTIDAVTGTTMKILELKDELIFESATWSPDGGAIGFTRCNDGYDVCDVYSVAAQAGAKPTRLTRTRGVELGVDWGP